MDENGTALATSPPYGQLFCHDVALLAAAFPNQLLAGGPALHIGSVVAIIVTARSGAADGCNAVGTKDRHSLSFFVDGTEVRQCDTRLS